MDKVLRRIEDLEIDGILESTIKSPEELKLRDIKVVKVYYCFYGRNAWRSTWVQKYYKDCMHSSFYSAMQFAEANRVRGSVFYINELPALFFDGGNYPVLATQINKKCPLRGYSSKALREKVAPRFEKIEGHRDDSLALGAPMNGVISSFEYNSRFWRTQQPRNNSMILLFSETEFEPVELKTTKLRTWKSESIGTKNYLLWNQSNSWVRQSAVLRIYNQSGFNPKKPIKKNNPD